MRNLLICLALIIAAGSANALLAAEKPGRPVLEFNLGACPMDSKDKGGIVKVTWLNDNTLFVKTVVGALCSGQTFTGGYELKEDSLVLKYKSRIDGVVSRCSCAQELIYKLNNIPKKDYKITLQDENKENSEEGK